MSSCDWRRVPIGLDARRGATRGGCKTVLVIVHTVTSGPMASDHDDVNLRGHIHHAVETSPTWDHLRWMRTVTDLPIILKGILTGEHTRLVVRAGARAVVVRDHAGRPRDRITCAGRPARGRGFSRHSDPRPPGWRHPVGH